MSSGKTSASSPRRLHKKVGFVRVFSTALLALFLLASGAGLRESPAASRDIIICGSGGDEDYRMKFHTWGLRLKTALIERLGRSADDVVLLMESADGESTGPNTSALEGIRAALEKATQELQANDELCLYLIGHGSHWQRVSRFHIPGPDLTADELAKLLEPLRAERFVLVNASSASAGFINTLSKPGRVICTATKSVEERNATEFMEYFIQALEDGSADQDRDERISILEACRQAAVLTEAYYVGEGLIATEHALIDDNGDGRGTRLVEDVRRERPDEPKRPEAADKRDGAAAGLVYLKDFSFPDTVPRELVDRYLSLLGRVESLKGKKDEMESDAYYAELESLLVEAARAHREIRRAEPH